MSNKICNVENEISNSTSHKKRRASERERKREREREREKQKHNPTSKAFLELLKNVH